MKPSMIQAVIFDMDGVLVDSEPYWARARAEFAAEHGQEWTKEDQAQAMGRGSREWADYMIRRLRPRRAGRDMTVAEVIDDIVERMRRFYDEGIPFLPGAVEAVRAAAKGWRVALASGSDARLIEIVVHHPDLRGRFEAVVASDTLPRGKPFPDVYLETARRLGIKPEEAACVEDSPNGILAGRRAGMYVIAVPSPAVPLTPEQLAPADLVLGSLMEFPRALEALKRS